jgi:hypothetical protein
MTDQWRPDEIPVSDKPPIVTVGELRKSPRVVSAELIAKLPSSVRVGPFDFRLERWSSHAADDARAWGRCSYSEIAIRIQENIPLPEKAADVLLHEIGHAIFWTWKLQDGDKEERIVSTMATAWTQVYRDNPWLIDWIKEAIAP